MPRVSSATLFTFLMVVPDAQAPPGNAREGERHGGGRGGGTPAVGGGAGSVHQPRQNLRAAGPDGPAVPRAAESERLARSSSPTNWTAATARAAGQRKAKVSRDRAR